MTPEREQEIREKLADQYAIGEIRLDDYNLIVELLAELDAVKAERDAYHTDLVYVREERDYLLERLKDHPGPKICSPEKEEA